MFRFAQTLVACCPSVAVDLSAGETMPVSTLENSQMNMMTIRKCAARVGVVALCTAALSTVPMMAQGGGGGGRMQMTSDQRVAMIDKAVTLTDDQKIKIKAIYEDDMKKMADLRASQDPDMRTK